MCWYLSIIVSVYMFHLHNYVMDFDEVWYCEWNFIGMK